MNTGKIFERLIRLLYPPRCIFCKSIMDINTEIEICSECYSKIPFMPENRYDKLKGFEYDSNWDDLICVCEYRDIIKDAIIRYKFFGKSSYYRAFGNLLAKRMYDLLNRYTFDIIMSVPLHNNKRKKRGYNQCKLITRLLSRKTGISEKTYLLKRVRKTKSQSLLTKDERYFNVKNAFKLTDKDKIKNKNVILLDDILTTV